MTLLTAAPYTDWLVRTLTDAAYQARLADAQTIPVTVTRHQCPHCRRTWAKKNAATRHVARCWHNPAVKGCKTCHHLTPPEDGPYPEHPGWPEQCEEGRKFTAGLHTNCPLWTALNVA